MVDEITIRRGTQSPMTALGTNVPRMGIGESYYYSNIGGSAGMGPDGGPTIRRPAPLVVPNGAVIHITYHMQGYFYERNPPIWDTWEYVDEPKLTPPSKEHVHGASVVGIS